MAEEQSELDLKDIQKFRVLHEAPTPLWRVVSRVKLVYSEQNGNEPDIIYILQPIVSGFELADGVPAW